MKLKNSALQELYDVIVKSTITISPYAVSPVDEAFRECDEKLSGLLVFEHIKSLEKDLDDAKNQLKYFTDSRDAWRGRAKHAENEVEELKATKIELQNDRNFYRDLYTDLRKDYYNLSEENRKLNARTNCLREELEWYRKHYKEKCEKEVRECFNAMIDGFETMECPYLGRPSVIEIQFDPDQIVFRKED